MQVFISYAKEDIKIANKIFYELKNEGLSPWIDHENLLPGQNWKDTIIKAIKESAYFIALLSINSINKRGFVQKELKIALDILDECSDSDIFLIPIRIDTCEPSSEKLKEIQWVDLFPSFEIGLKKVIKVLKSKPIDTCEPSSEKLKEIQWVDLFPSFEIGLKKVIKVFNSKPLAPLATKKQYIIKEDSISYEGSGILDHSKNYEINNPDNIINLIEEESSIGNKEHNCEKFIIEVINSWTHIEELKPLVLILEKERRSISKNIRTILNHKTKSKNSKYREAIKYLLNYSLSKLHVQLTMDHLVLYNQRKTVKLIFEKRFLLVQHNPFLPYQNDVINIFLKCLSNKINKKKASSLITFFYDIKTINENHLRYKLLLWFIYLTIEIVVIDQSISSVTQIKSRMAEGFSIVNDEIFHNSIFKILEIKGAELKKFLLRDFNLQQSTSKYINRRLTSEYRQCVYNEVLKRKKDFIKSNKSLG